jgi:hypothetical protein
MSNALRTLLQQQYLHAYQDFVAEYRRCAKDLDSPREVVPPTKSQYYRWISGQVRTLPHPYHCRVLEQMFPGWSAQELFRPPGQRLNTDAPIADEFSLSVIPGLDPADLEGVWVTGYLLGGGRGRHIDLSTVTATKHGVVSRNYPPSPRLEGHHCGHESRAGARLYRRHLIGQFHNVNDRYFFGSFHLAVMPGETILSGYYTGFLNDSEVVAEPWKWVRVDPQSLTGIDLATVTLGDPARIYDTIAARTQFDGQIPLAEIIQ